MIKTNKNSADWAELLQLAFRLLCVLEMRTIDEVFQMQPHQMAVSMGRWNLPPPLPPLDSYLPPG